MKCREATEGIAFGALGRVSATLARALGFGIGQHAGMSDDQIRASLEDTVLVRTLKAAVKLANEKLAARDLPPLPEHLTPHRLRGTFAALLRAVGEAA